ncbi:MAG TPA: hypothetical protein VMN39_11135 [Longimicrobiaceae bacterium]|nr:hypothetical protein [Longimicrobiaceae bacterium]
MKEFQFRLPSGVLLAFLAACGSSQEEAAVGTSDICRVLQVPVPLPDVLTEASGFAVSRNHPGVIWSHNDSGGEAELVAVDSGGRLLGRVAVAGAENRDWEDLALGPCPAGECLYIADIGDNQGRHQEVVIYRVPEPSPVSARTAAADPLRARYPDGPRDAEALFLLPPDRLYLVTKGTHGPIEIFAFGTLPATDQPVTLELVAALSAGPVPLPDQVTAADASADGTWVAIRTYTSLLFYSTDRLLAGELAEPIRFDLASLGEAQGEALALGPGGSVVLGSEGVASGFPGTIAVLWCAAVVGSEPAPLESPTASPAADRER